MYDRFSTERNEFLCYRRLSLGALESVSFEQVPAESSDSDGKSACESSRFCVAFLFKFRKTLPQMKLSASLRFTSC
jgi:hypothetical protein